MKKIFIGGAWPYANYNMHIGHLAALLPGDVIARYFRQHGDSVLYVSGTDTHGTPITEAARKEGINALDLATFYHDQNTKDFADLGFTYDNYGATFMDWHKKEVKEIFKQIYANGYLYDKIIEQIYCEKCCNFLSDREIGGNCPVCHLETKGDQCNSCLSTFNPREVVNACCLICEEESILKLNNELVFSLSKFQKQIEDFFEKNSSFWRKNAINETNKYLNQGLPDRDVTRNLNWGIDVPFTGYEDKCIYVWFEAVLGYLTSGKYAAEKKGINFDTFIKEDENLETYYIHGKDNISFHTIILPALISALEKPIQLPKRIISSEYININNEKMSKSKGNVITIRDLLEEFEADTIRFYFIFNNPERRDTSYSREDLISQHNKFLVGGFGNFVNRNLSFLMKEFQGIIPLGQIDGTVRKSTICLYDTIGKQIANGELRNALENMLSYIQEANRYYDEQKPWIHVKESDKTNFNNITVTCLYMMANMSNLFAPIIPFGCAKLREMLQMPKEFSWVEVDIQKHLTLSDIKVLYQRL